MHASKATSIVALQSKLADLAALEQCAHNAAFAMPQSQALSTTHGANVLACMVQAMEVSMYAAAGAGPYLVGVVCCGYPPTIVSKGGGQRGETGPGGQERGGAGVWPNQRGEQRSKRHASQVCVRVQAEHMM